MLISHRHKFVTIDIPKTGTRSFRDTLKHILGLHDKYGEHGMLIARNDPSEPFTQHGDVSQARKGFVSLGWNWAQYKTYTVVRNPWARYYSFYKYLKKQSDKVDEPNWESLPAPVKNQSSNARKIFDRFENDTDAFKHIIKSNPAQHEYYTIKEQIMVDNIATFENLQAGFDKICTDCGLESRELYHSNKGEYKETYKEFYNQETIDMVASKEQYTVQLKQYDYEYNS